MLGGVGVEVLTKSEVGEEDGRLDAADVGVVHDLDGQSGFHKVHHVVEGKKGDGESDVVGAEDKDVGEVSNCEELGRSAHELAVYRTGMITHYRQNDEVVIWAGVLDQNEAADTSQYHEYRYVLVSMSHMSP